MGIIFLPTQTFRHMLIGQAILLIVTLLLDIASCSRHLLFLGEVRSRQLFLALVWKLNIVHLLILPLNFSCRIWVFPLRAVLLFIVTILVSFSTMMFFHERMKHIKIYCRFIRHHTRRDALRLHYVSCVNQLVDIFKAHPPGSWFDLQTQVGIFDPMIPSWVWGGVNIFLI